MKISPIPTETQKEKWEKEEEDDGMLRSSLEEGFDGQREILEVGGGRWSLSKQDRGPQRNVESFPTHRRNMRVGGD